MQRWVLLKHDLPDGSCHLDWMLEASRHVAPALVTFRVAERPDDPGVAAFPAERIGDHRRDYLEYEGPVSGGRGAVSRVGAGVCSILRDDDLFEVVIQGSSPGEGRRWVGRRAGRPRPEGGALYEFRLAE